MSKNNNLTAFDVRRTQPKLNAKEAWERTISRKKLASLVGRLSTGRTRKYVKDP